MGFYRGRVVLCTVDWGQQRVIINKDSLNGMPIAAVRRIRKDTGDKIEFKEFQGDFSWKGYSEAYFSERTIKVGAIKADGKGREFVEFKEDYDLFYRQTEDEDDI